MPGRHVVTAPDEAELAAAVHENLYALFRSMQLLPGGELEESTSLSLHHAFPPNPMFRGAWRSRLSPEEVERSIDRVVEWFGRRGAPSFFWWTDRQTRLQRPGRPETALPPRGRRVGVAGRCGLMRLTKAAGFKSGESRSIQGLLRSGSGRQRRFLCVPNP
jgi:hypothetical protein